MLRDRKSNRDTFLLRSLTCAEFIFSMAAVPALVGLQVPQKKRGRNLQFFEGIIRKRHLVYLLQHPSNYKYSSRDWIDPFSAIFDAITTKTVWWASALIADYMRI